MQNFVRLRKNKAFSYAPRYYQGGNHPFKMLHKFDTSRSTSPAAKGLATKFSAAIEDLKIRGDKHHTLRLLIITAVLVIAFFFSIGFDLSIFLAL